MGNKSNQEPKKLLNSICEVQIDGKMALVSLYDDLPHFEYDMTIDNLKNSNSKLKAYIKELKESNQKLEKELLHFKSINKTLSKNITSLYKTATTEIERKDKMIEELRQSQIFAQPTSKMFSSNNYSLKEKNEVPKSSEENKDTNKINLTIDASKELNQNGSSDITNIIIHPNLNIPKTVYYKRLCQKLVSQNETSKSNKIMPKQKENINTNTSNKITHDKNEELKDDCGKLKEIATPLIHNDHLENLNSTLVISKTNEMLSESNINNTSIVQNENPEKCKENTSSSSFFTKLKSPVKLKKKMVITPATIGVQNVSNNTLKDAEKLNVNKNVDSSALCTINSPQNKTIKTLNKDTLPAFINENKDTKIDLKTHEKLVHQQYSFTSVNDNNSLFEMKTSPCIFKDKVKTEEMNCSTVPKSEKSLFNICKQLSIDNNAIKCVKSLTKNRNESLEKSLSPNTNKQLSANNEYNESIKCEKLSKKCENKCIRQKSLTISSNQISTDYNYDKSVKNVKSPSKNEKKSSSSPLKKNNLSEYKLPVTKDFCNVTKLTESNNSIKNCGKRKSYDTNYVDKTSINIEVEQIPFKTRTVKILKDNNTLTTTIMKECSGVTYRNTLINNESNVVNKHITNLNTSNENELISLEQQKNRLTSPTSYHISNIAEFNLSNSSLKNKSDEITIVNNTSVNIEVEQGLIFRKSKRKVITHSSFDHDKTETKKGRRVQLITIKDHCSQPLTSFYGAEKKEIDVSKNAIHIEKVVESSSQFYIPQVKRRRTINFSNSES